MGATINAPLTLGLKTVGAVGAAETCDNFTKPSWVVVAAGIPRSWLVAPATICCPVKNTNRLLTTFPIGIALTKRSGLTRLLKSAPAATEVLLFSGSACRRPEHAGLESIICAN